MIKTSLYSFLFLLMGVFSVAQSSQEVDFVFSDYYSANKAIHLHLNKTTYIAGEDIWFRAYIYNKNQNIISTIDNENLSVELFDQNKGKIESKTLAFTKGSAYGNFKLSDSIPSGNYYIRAYIPEMNSHRFDESFNQKIEILNLSDESTSDKNNITANPKYDIQILPEGGHLVSDILNTCGLKIIDQNGIGVDFDDIVIVDDNDNKITNVNTNQFGHGKFAFIPQTNTSYFIKVNANNKSLKKQLPKSLNEGVLMSANHNYQKEQLLLKFISNSGNSIKSLSNNWNLLIRKDNQLKELELNPKHDNPEYGIVIPYETFFSGVNTITLLDNETPILERQVFIYKNINTVALEIDTVIRENDSIEFTLKNNKKLLGNYSISILPQRTIANNNRNTIYNSFLLKPYLNGRIETPAYYFENITTKVKHDMDLLMLTQGWSKYKWEYLNKDNTEQENTFGYDIKGTVNPDAFVKKGLKVLLASNGNNLKLTEVDESKEFYFKDLNLTKDNLANLTLIDKKDKAILSKFSYNIISKNTTLKFPLAVFKNEKIITNDIDEFYKEPINDSINKLDEVLIEAEVFKREKEVRKKFFGVNYAVKIDSSYHGYGTLINYIEILKKQYPKLFGITFINEAPYSSAIHGWIPVKYIDEFYFTPSERPVIDPLRLFIYLKDPLPIPKSLQKTKDYIISKGFDSQKEFYRPLYDSYTSTDYNRYGVVWWFPDITTEDDGKLSFKIPNEAYSKFKFFIEGYTENGVLISNIIDVNSNPKTIN